MEKGIYNIYKPKGPSSYDVIRRVKELTDEKRIGHGGTLDPLASGVLVVAIGREYTKKLDEFSRGKKEYEATIKFGQTSTTQDEEGEKTNVKVNNIPSENDIKSALKDFVGDIKQTPPIFSALKVKGQPAYKLARQGKDIEMKERKVKISNIKMLKYKWPTLKIRVGCSGGTYIRTLASDIGSSLKIGGYLAELKRVKVGNFKIEDSIHLEEK